MSTIDKDIVNLLSTIYDDNCKCIDNCYENYIKIKDCTKDFYSAPIAPNKDKFDYMKTLNLCKSFYDKK